MQFIDVFYSPYYLLTLCLFTFYRIIKYKYLFSLLHKIHCSENIIKYQINRIEYR
jgi:hypothetical protein